MSLLGEACARVSRYLLRHADEGSISRNVHSFENSSYQEWRHRELESQFNEYFSTDLLKDRDVVDLGCGGGELSLFAIQKGAKSVYGIEASESQYCIACAQLRNANLPHEPVFLLANDACRIPLNDEEHDTILCFDVLEHVMCYEAIIHEWHRILRPNGCVLIWWVPYYHPYGHHVQSLVPIPWVHALLSDRTIIEACAKVYESPDFEPRFWDLDEKGQKKPNKWLTLNELPDLNKLKIEQFETSARGMGFNFEQRLYRPISSSRFARALSSALIGMPALRDYFTSCVVYQLRKPAA